jgi:hypothetical protein
MRVQDLRIGNLVQTCNSKHVTSEGFGKIVEVESIYYNGINISIEFDSITADINEDNLIGIPLTEEWIKDKTFNCEGFTLKMMSDKCLIYVNSSKGKPTLSIDEKTGKPHIEHLHELQNLFHALTREELTYEKA